MSAELVSRISELLRVILHSNMLSLSGSTEYRAYITRLVACSPHKELLALLNAVHNPRAVQSHITNILKKDGCRSIRPEFILRYLRWLKEFVSLSKPGIGFTWKRYLKDGYALSYALQVCETPQSFLAEVPHMWLFNIVTRMSKETADIPRRDDAMRVVMKSLSCYTFSRVLTKSELGKHRALMRFMLGYLDDEARIAYLASAKFLKSYNGKSRHKKFVDVYRDIEEELNSHISTARNTLAITSAVQ
ncbi:hypothetical protein PAPHI01_2240 [Pancytospora philotis]|nr:hypothetical protein PAPHI01_2240 [Pancytospora philotis]